MTTGVVKTGSHRPGLAKISRVDGFSTSRRGPGAGMAAGEHLPLFVAMRGRVDGGLAAGWATPKINADALSFVWTVFCEAENPTLTTLGIFFCNLALHYTRP